MLDVLSMQQAADRIGVTRACMSKWRKQGVGPDSFVLVDSYNAPVLYLRSVVEDWISKNPERVRSRSET